MRVPRSGLDLSVSKQLADHRQPLADEQPTGRERVAKIVDAHVGES
jgi:hypothetical protein